VRAYLKQTCHKKRAGGVSQGVSPEFKPQYYKKKKKKEKNHYCYTHFGDEQTKT
jgi:hypothetical protein